MKPEEGKRGEAAHKGNGHTKAPNCHRDRDVPVTGQGDKHDDAHHTCPHQCDEDIFLTNEEIDQLIVATDVGCSMVSQPFYEEDVGRVYDWARGARIGSTMLHLVLDGQIVPVRIKEDSEIGFRTVTGTLTQVEATAYRAKWARLKHSGR